MLWGIMEINNLSIYLDLYFFNFIYFNIIFILYINIIKWGLGIGDWGLGIGDWAQSPIPNPQSPIPNPQSPCIYLLNNILNNIYLLTN